jgi:hypothetical protein
LRALLESTGGEWDEVASLYRTAVAPLNQDQGRLWEQCKRQGLNAVPPGQANSAASDIIRRLAEQRVLVVPVGELEGFDRTISGKGARWVTAMLAQDGHKECLAAVEFVKHIY